MTVAAALPPPAASVPRDRAHADARPMVAIEDVSMRFGDLLALDRVSLAVARGEILCLLGPSGSGKSTLLRLIAGIERPTQGRIQLDATDVVAPAVFVEPERRHVGMVFQDFALFPHLTVAANVAFGLNDRPRAEAARIAAGLLNRVGLSRYAASYPHVLSGGERQRVALARALAREPRVLLMDEPFSSLDGELRDRVRQDTVRLLRELNTTTILVTHDPSEAIRVADRIALLREGRLLQCGSPEDLYLRPTTAFAARLFGDVNELPGICRGGRVGTPLGSFPADLPDDAAVRVCIRPQHLRIAPTPTAVRARVLVAEFLGEGYRVSLDVANLAGPMVMHVAERGRPEPGTDVYLDLNPASVVIVRDDEAVDA